MRNRLVVIGDLTDEIKIKEENGIPVAEFVLQVEKNDYEIEFIPLKAFRSIAVDLAKEVKKGMKVYIRGRVEACGYEKDSNKNRSIELVVKTFEVVGERL